MCIVISNGNFSFQLRSNIFIFKKTNEEGKDCVSLFVHFIKCLETRYVTNCVVSHSENRICLPLKYRNSDGESVILNHIVYRILLIKIVTINYEIIHSTMRQRERGGKIKL